MEWCGSSPSSEVMKGDGRSMKGDGRSMKGDGRSGVGGASWRLVPGTSSRRMNGVVWFLAVLRGDEGRRAQHEGRRAQHEGRRAQWSWWRFGATCSGNK